MVTMQDAIILARTVKRDLKNTLVGVSLEDLSLQDLYDHADAFLKAAGEEEPK